MVMAYPEAVCLRKQMADVLVGKEIADLTVVDVTKIEGSWRFGSITQSPDVFRDRLRGGTVTGAESVANSVFLAMSTGYSLGLGYLSGPVRLHPVGEELPKRSCLSLCFSDGSHLSVVISMWGIIRALSDDEKPAYLAKWYGRAIEPLSKEYTWKGFRDAAAQVEDAKLSAKKFLHAFEPGHYVSGIDAGYALEILYGARVHPKRTLASLTLNEQRAYYHSVNRVMKEAVRKGGLWDYPGLDGRPGGFVPHVCRATLGKPCPECGKPIEKLKFEGGSSYVCPTCQPI